MADTTVNIDPTVNELVEITNVVAKSVQKFNITPRITERTINEFDDLEPALIVTNYEAVDCTFEYVDSDSNLVDAAINDQDPTATVVVDDPSAYQPFNLFANSKSLTTGKIFASTLVIYVLSPFFSFFSIASQISWKA